MQNRFEVNRRTATAVLAGGLVSGHESRTLNAAIETKREEPLTLGMGTYATKLLKTEKAIRLISDTGFDSVELTVNAGWDAAPENMPAQRRVEISQQLKASGLHLTSLMEHTVPSKDDAKAAENLKRIQRAASLSRDLATHEPPVIQTVLGGGKWEEQKNLFVDRVSKWGEAAAKFGVTVLVKPHRGAAMSTPADGVWLVEKINNKHVRLCYDYSHFIYRDLDLVKTIHQAAPYTQHIAIKDTVKKPDGGFQFVLPGEAGTIDYVKLLQTFYDDGYRGDICCEVSGMVWSKPGYDPVAAVKTCYKNVAKVFSEAGIKRPA